MLRPLLGALFGAVILLGAACAQAQDLAWADREEPLTYGVVPAPPAALASAAAVSVARGAGEPAWPVLSVGDLVWRYGLSLPADRTVPADGQATRELADSFALADGGRVDVTGTARLGRVGGGRVRVELSLVLTGSALGALDMDLLFDVQRGRLEAAEFDLAAGLRWKGRITEQPGAEAPVAPQAKPLAPKPGEPLAPRPGEPEPADPPEPKPAVPAAAPVDPLHAQVVSAVERGKAHLLPLTQQRLLQYQGQRAMGPGYQAMGRLALPCFALLRSGTPAEVLDPAFDWLKTQPLSETYSVALYVMALEARSVTRQVVPPRPEPSRTVTRFQRGLLPAADRLLIQGAVAWLLAARNQGAGSWSYKGSGGTGEDRRRALGRRGDRSNSQFAVLALHSALAAGVDVPADVWEEIAREGLASQEPTGERQSLAGSIYTKGAAGKAPPAARKAKGTRARKRRAQGLDGSQAATLARGWGYGMSAQTPSGRAYGSMTAAGVSSLAVALEGLERRAGAERTQAAASEAMQGGLAWLLRSFDPRSNPSAAGGGRGHYYYYAYSFEKAMDTAGVERLGEVEWWREFAKVLVSQQTADGGWGSLEDTSFALLVLNRATLSARIDGPGRARTGPGAKHSWEWVRVEGELMSAPQLIAALRVPGTDRATFKRAKRAWEELPIEHRPRLLPALVELITESDKPIQRWARARCKELTGTDAPDAAAALFETWDGLRVASERGDHGRLEFVRELLRAEDTPEVLLRQALSALGRLGGAEGLGDVIELLDRPGRAWREQVWAHVVGLAGREPVAFDPGGSKAERDEQLAALRTWWIDAKQEASLEAQIRRAISDLSRDTRRPAAEERLRAIGRPALRALIDALRTESARAAAHLLLEEITGQALPPDPEPWLAWLADG